MVFERLFGAGDAGTRQAAFQERQQQQKSILDFAAAEAEQLNRQLGRNDRNKLDEYLSGIREIERRIQRVEQFGPLADPGVPAPNDAPGSYREHIHLMSDMLVLAFQTDSTRIATFLMAHDGSNRTFEDIGVRDGHHSLSHHQNDKTKMEKIAKIDTFYIEQLAYFLKAMRETKDRDGKSLLDNSMIVYASGLSDGNRHKHDNLPVILAGRGGGALSVGRHAQLPPTPMNNLYMTMLDLMGAKVDHFGDSTGRVSV
jgi:hypothetical protein